MRLHPFANRSLLTWCAAALLASLFSSTPARSAEQPARANTALRVLTSFLPVHSMALAVAGDRAVVENWIPQGVDPHEFQFSPKDIRRLREARLLVVGGLMLEGWKLANLREISGNPRLELIEAAAGLGPGELVATEAHADATAGSSKHDPHDGDGHDHHGTEGGPNPHFWLDPLLGAHAVTNLVRAFAEADPANASVYQANGQAYVARLKALDAEYRERLARVQSQAFITFHDAFPYLARRYGLRLAGVVERNAAEDPSARELANLAAVARKENVRVLFVDGPPSRLARRIASDWRIRIASLETLETGKLGPTAYEDGLRRNLQALVSGLAASDAK